MRNHAGQNVNAGRQPLPDNGRARLLRLDSGRVSRIDEDRAFHRKVPLHEPLRPSQYERIAFVASKTPEAAEALAKLAAHYGNVEPDKAEVIVALGGDGLMLQTLRKLHAVGQADLRHASRHGRLPDERVSRGSA